MKVIIAPDKFKGSLTSFEVCNAISAGIKNADKNIDVLCFPMADGGDGFALVMQYYLRTRTIECIATDPLGKRIETSYQWCQEESTAIIEMASASGLVLLKQDERNPLKASSYGTGLLIKDAVSKGAKKIILGVGGSATNDAGTGILAALGFLFADKAGNLLEACGKNLVLIDNIIPPPELPEICLKWLVMYRMFYMAPGAAYIYAPQKGASVEEVSLLDDGLKHFAEVLKHKTGKDVTNYSGTGAAGGVVAGLIPFFDVTLKSGIELIIDASDIESKIKGANLLITGEGKIDRQTLQGKVVSKLALFAHQHEMPAIAFCGVLEADGSLIKELKLQAAKSISSASVSIAEAITNARQLLTDKTEEYFKNIKKS